MTNRAIKKVLSLVLSLCILLSTVCGCIISVNAATAGLVYTINGEDVAAGTKTTTMTVTINGTNLTSGKFDLMFGRDVIDDVNFDVNGNYVTPKNETVDEFLNRDKDGNNMIATENVYKEVDVPVYNDNGEQTGTTKQKVIDSEATKKNQENSGNKGTLLPNVYDNTNGLWNTKIEITGGTKADGTVVSAEDINSYFTNGDYDEFAFGEGNTANAVYKNDTSEGKDPSLVIDDDKDGRKYIYNITPDYYTAQKSKVTYVDTDTPQTDADGNVLVDEEGKTVWKQAPVTDDKMLLRYYREYTTVDVATPHLEYAISTVSEDTVGSCHAYAQYAQGFKDITFSANEAFSSITFTVTLDFSGICDRISANSGVDDDKMIGTTTVDGQEVNYKLSDGRWGSENYIGYGKKYQLNLLNATGDIDGIAAVSTNVNTDYFHVHSGYIDTSAEGALLNEAAIKAAGYSAPDNVNYFGLYNATCDTCKRVTPMLASTDMPYRRTIKNEDGTTSNISAKSGAYAFNNYRNVSGISLTYQNDGSVSLNIHYPSTMEGEQIIITDENGKVFKYSDVVEDTNGKDVTSLYEAKDSFYKSEKTDDNVQKYSGLLMSTSKMITIDGFSAADADKTLYIARYTPASSTETQLMGITHSISLSDYCNRVIQGDKVYYLGGDNYSETKIEQDKQVAAAFINYAKAAKLALATPNDYKAFDKTDVWEANKSFNKQWDEHNLLDGKLADNGEKGDSWDTAIIIDTAEELAYLSKVGGDNTAGKYYKVADGIKYFDMSRGIDLSKSLDDNLDTLKKGLNFSGNDPAFQGYFDGNGVTVYGIYNPGTFAGVFSSTKGNVTIKNLNVTMSCFISKYAAGGIVGKYKGDGTQTLLIENCSVTNCHIESNGEGDQRAVGAIFGYAHNYDGGSNKNGPVKVNNCYINLNEEHFVSLGETQTVRSIHGGIGGQAVTNYENKFTNCVVIGINPWASYPADYDSDNNHQHTAGARLFKNIYTNVEVGNSVDVGGTSGYALQNYTTNIKQLTENQMTGEAAKENMPALDWYTTWHTTTDGYPELYTPYNTPKNVGKTIYWDANATVATGFAEGSGTKDDPYIINTVAELAYLVRDFDSTPKIDTADKKAASSLNKHFKVADGIKNIVLQPETYAADIMALADAQAVKTYFENNANSMKKWANEGWEKGAFCGTFDGNGATIYGLYQNSNSNAGLFTTIDAGATIKNISVKNSYMKSSESWNGTASPSRYDAYQVGAIAAVSSGNTYGQMQDGVIWIDGCTVANNYMQNNIVYNTTAHQRNGVIMGASSDAVYVENCLTYGNHTVYGNINGVTETGENSTKVSYTDTYEMSYLSTGGSNAGQADNTIVPEGLKTVTSGVSSTGNPLYVNKVRNCLFLGTAPYSTNAAPQARFNTNICCEDVYTDTTAGIITFADGQTRTYTPAQLTQVSLNEIKGLSAKSVMTELDWYDIMTNPDGKWHCSYLSAMPSLTPIDESIATLYPAYDIEFTEPDTLGYYENHENGTMTFGVYKTALSLYANPYMSFAFAFYGEYREKRDKLKIRFTYTENSVEKTTEEIQVATDADADGDGLPDLCAGWLNNQSAGRYHTYQAIGIPVEALAHGIKVEASYNSNEWKDLGTFSAKGLGYEFAKYNTDETPSDYYATRVEVTRALVFYADAIKTRYGNV